MRAARRAAATRSIAFRKADMALSPFVVWSEHFDLLLRRERRIAADILEQGIDP